MGCTQNQLISAGYSQAEVSNPCGEEALKKDLDRGLTPETILARGCTEAQLRSFGLPVTSAEAALRASEKRGKLTDLEKAREAKLSVEERREQLEAAKRSMEGTAQALFQAWTPPATQILIVAPEPQKKEGTTTTTTEVIVKPGAGPVSVITKPVGTIIKAGTVMYGVVDTAINSDENSPILASIVSGPLKGGKLVGKFVTVGEKVRVDFDLLNSPQFASSVPLKAVAIDSETARTALASEVDRHNLLRYGTLFASSFLSGLAQAISSSGQQSSSGAGGLVVTNATLTTGEKFAVALGRVGTEYASVLGNTFTTPPTITVEAGTSIGILFMVDVTLPGKIPFRI